MSRALSISARRRYGLARLWLSWRLSRATLHRHLKAATRPDGPPAERKIWARLRHAGVRTSPRRVPRLMRARPAGASAGGVAERAAGP